MKNALFLAGLLFFVACTQEERSATVTYADMSDVMNHVEKIPLETWAKSVKYIPLETSDSVLIQFINNPKLVNGRFLMAIQDRHLTFDMEGRFLHNIARPGQGPEEYTSDKELIATPEEIIILDAGDKTKHYSWEGKFLRREYIPKRLITDIHPLSGTNLTVGYVSNMTGLEPTRLYFFRDTTIVGSNPYAKKYDDVKVKMMVWGECNFFNLDDNTVAFKEMFNDTVYTINKEMELTPYVIFKFGKEALTAEERYNQIDPRKNIMRNRICPLVIGEHNETLYLSRVFLDGESYTLYYDKKTQEGKAVQLTLPNNEELGITDDQEIYIQGISADNKYLISSVQPENDNNPIMLLIER